MKKVLLTGASGFIGSYLLKQLTMDGYDVIGVANKNLNDSFIKCDLQIKSDVFKLISDVNPDIIIHAAALSSVTQGQTIDYYKLNVIVSENLYQAVESLPGEKRRIILLSTAGVYGNQGVDCLTEDLSPKPVSHYGLSKFVCERMLQNISEKHNITILRPFNVIGYGQSEGFLIPKLIKHFALKSEVIELGNIQTFRDYIDVDSSCKIISSIIRNPKSYGEIINICSGKATSINQLLDILTNLTSHKIKVLSTPNNIRTNEIWTLIGSTVKLNTMTQVTFDDKSLIASLDNMLRMNVNNL